MRATITFDDDVAVAIRQLRRAKDLGIRATVNELVRRGLVRSEAKKPFVQKSSAGKALVDVTDVADVAEVLEFLEEPDAR